MEGSKVASVSRWFRTFIRSHGKFDYLELLIKLDLLIDVTLLVRYHGTYCFGADRLDQYIWHIVCTFIILKLFFNLRTLTGPANVACQRVDIEFCHLHLLFAHALPLAVPLPPSESVRFSRVADLYSRILRRIPRLLEHPRTSIGDSGIFNLLLNF